MKLIAIDLDGTLLNHNHEISEENIKAIKHAQDKGIQVSIATGRAQKDVLSILKKAGLNTHIISNNGSSIHLNTGEKLKSISLSKEEVKPILEWLEDNKYFYEISNDHSIFSFHKGFEYLSEEIENLKARNADIDINQVEYMYSILKGQKGVIPVDSYKEILEATEEFYNIMVISLDDEKRLRGKEYFMNNNNLYVFSSFSNNFEMVHKNASKGSALEILANTLNVSLKDVMAIGDNYNDITMLKKAGYSVAMGNAEEEVKKICKFTTLDNNDHGVAHAIMNKLSKAC